MSNEAQQKEFINDNYKVKVIYYKDFDGTMTVGLAVNGPKLKWWERVMKALEYIITGDDTIFALLSPDHQEGITHVFLNAQPEDDLEDVFANVNVYRLSEEGKLELVEDVTQVERDDDPTAIDFGANI